MFILFLASVILFAFAIVTFIISLIKKKDKKKSLYIFIASVICFVISIALTPSSETTTKKTGEADNSVIETEKQETAYKVGDVIKITTSSGSYNLSITGISETKERNQYSDVKADRVVIIDYAYENIDTEGELFISDMSFKAYDANNNALETYPVHTKAADGISAGRKTTAQMAFAINNDTNRIELEYFDNMFNNKKDCLIVIEW